MVTTYYKLASQTSSNKKRAAELAGRSTYSEIGVSTQKTETPSEYTSKVTSEKVAVVQPVVETVTTQPTSIAEVLQSQRAQAGIQESKAVGVVAPSTKTMTTPSISVMESALKSSTTSTRSPALAYLDTQKTTKQAAIGALTAYKSAIDTKLQAAQTKGVESAKAFELSDISKSAYEKTQSIASTIRAGTPTLVEKTGAAGEVLKYPVESTARLIEFAGMLPGGVETLARQPSIIPTALTVGALSVPVGISTSAKEEPKQFISDIGTQVLFGYGIGKVGASVKGTAKTIGKSKVQVETLAQPEVIAGEAAFPVAERGTPIPEVIETFKTTKYRYPETLETGREYGIHTSGINLPKELTTLKGTSETPGLYVGPDVSLYFTGIKEAKSIKLFGLDTPKTEPSISFVGLRSIERLPESIRASTREANIFMMESAPKEVGFTSVKMEQGLKVGARERELIIPPESMFRKVETKYYTQYKGENIPISRYEPLETTIAGTKPTSRLKSAISTMKTKEYAASDIYSYTAPSEKAIITPSKIYKFPTTYKYNRYGVNKLSTSVKPYTNAISGISKTYKKQYGYGFTASYGNVPSFGSSIKASDKYSSIYDTYSKASSIKVGGYEPTISTKPYASTAAYGSYQATTTERPKLLFYGFGESTAQLAPKKKTPSKIKISKKDKKIDKRKRRISSKRLAWTIENPVSGFESLYIDVVK